MAASRSTSVVAARLRNGATLRAVDPDHDEKKLRKDLGIAVLIALVPLTLIIVYQW